MSENILVIGGVAAGATGAAKARRTREDLNITMVEKGKYISFANCGLPYYTSGVIEKRASILLHTRQSFGKRFNTDVLTKTEAVAIDSKSKSVLLKTSKGEVERPYDKLLLAVGAKTFIPPIEGVEDIPYFTMRTVEDADGVKDYVLNNKLKDVLIIGAGFIGIEVAEAMIHCDLKPTVVEALDEVMPNFPPIVAMNLREKMAESGCDVIIKTFVTKLEKGDRIKAHLSDGRVLETDMVIMCTGVKPAVDLALTGGVEIGEKGGVAVNSRMETNIKDIYAAGDLVEKVNLVTGKKCLLPLAGPANREGRTAGMNMAGGDMEFKGVLGSSVVGFDGFVMAQTGLTYKQALEAGFDADYVYTEDVNRASYFPVHGHIFMMTVFEKKSGKLLGVSACGPDTVEKKIDHAAVALYAGLTVYDLEHIELCYAPPFASAKDNLNIAGFVASNMLRGTGFTIKPEWLLEQVSKNADVQIIDVRTPEEFKNYRVDGAVNIFVNELRDNLELIDKTRPVYVYCAVGFRGYLAVRSLRNFGFEAYNVTGGIEAYERLKRL